MSRVRLEVGAPEVVAAIVAELATAIFLGGFLATHIAGAGRRAADRA